MIAPTSRKAFIEMAALHASRVPRQLQEMSVRLEQDLLGPANLA